MSEVNHTTETPSVEPTTTEQPKIEEVSTAGPTTDAEESSKPDETIESKDEAVLADDKKDEAVVATKKPVEPITEGQLAVKGPGLLKSIIPSKKEFWLSDDSYSPQDLNSYMRGEKPEISHAVVAWASQTGKGLLFFNKKGDTARKQPGHVLALYNATNLKKQSPNEIAFTLNAETHVLKAASDGECDGWYISIEKGIELGKSMKEDIRESEGYKAEMEKLNKPNIAAGGAAAAAAKRSQSQPKKSIDVDKKDSPQRSNSDAVEDDKKDKKSRSMSRGMVERFKPKKDEKKDEKEEKKLETEESKPEDNKTEEMAAGGAAATGITAGAAAVEATGSEDKKDETVESPSESTPKTDERVKSKRGSIFGKMQAGWIKSPTKEKDQKDAELKPEVPPKDDVVSESPPQIPEATVDTDPSMEDAKAEIAAKPETMATDEKKDEKKDAITPSREKSGFLTTFMQKRRSVSPSTAMKDAPAKDVPAKDVAAKDVAAKDAPTNDEPSPEVVAKEAEAPEESKTDEAATETTAAETLKPAEKSEEKTAEKKEKRESVLGNLGRRASRAFKGMQAPKRENTAPSTEAKKEEATDISVPTEDKPITNGEAKTTEVQPSSIGDVGPDAIDIGKAEHQPATVTASA